MNCIIMMVISRSWRHKPSNALHAMNAHRRLNGYNRMIFMTRNDTRILFNIVSYEALINV